MRQHIPADRAAGAAAPESATEPVWIARQRADGRPTPSDGPVTITDAAQDHHRPLRLRRRPHARRATWPPAATRACAGRARPRRPTAVVDEVKAASLLGRGGAGFPAGVKWGFCPPGVWPRYLVVNGDESRAGHLQGPHPHGARSAPAHRGRPHRLLRGRAARRRSSTSAARWPWPRSASPHALNEAYAAGYVGKNILGTDFSVDIVLHWGAGAYIVGEETALIESLEGNRGMPRLKPPFFPAAKGLYLQPTIVNNVETLANLPWIIAQRRRRVRRRSAPRQSTGTRMFAVSGHVNKPGVFEVEFGVTTFRDLIYAPVYGGGIRDGQRAQGVHPRRRVGAVVLRGAPRPAARGRRRSARPARCSARAPSSSWTRPPTWCKACLRVVRFFARESCGKCTPCREGTSWLEKILQRIIDGHGRPERPRPAARRVRQHQPRHRLAAAGRPRSARSARRPSSPIASAVMRFRDEFEAYIGGPVEITVERQRRGRTRRSEPRTPHGR